ncbi:MAG TPA: PAS domain-containing protein, partial [Candidatus Obscuribacterales bacterium]
ENALRKSEKRFQRLAANMPGVIYRYRQFPDGRDRFSYVSPGSRDLWELDPDAVCIDASLVWSLVHPEDMERFAASIEQAIASGGQWFHEHRIITPSGQHKWIQAVARAEHKKDGSLTWDGVLIDVTARKLAELAFQASEDRFQRLAVNMPGIILRYHRDAEGGDRLSYLSPASREIWEVEPAAALADIQLVWQLIHPDDLAHLQAAIATSQTQLTPLVEDYRIITSTGRLKWLKLVARPVQDAPGQCLWDGLIIDVTEQKKTQQALQQSESLNRAIIEALPDLLIRMRRDGLCLDMHYPIWFNVVWPKERHVGRYIQEVIAPEVAAQRLTATALALTTQQTQVYDYQIPVNGEARWEEARVVPLAEDEVLVLIRDIHDRKQAEAALRESEALNRAIVEALPDLLLRMSRDGVCLNMQNPDTFPVLENTRSAIGRNIRDMLPPDLVQQRLTGIQQALATQETQVAEYQLMVRGQPRWEESRIVPLMENEVLILVRDVDERRRAENEVRRLNQILEEQNQRLEDLVELRTAELLTFMNALPDQIFVVDRTQNKMTFGNDVVARFAAQGHRKRFEGKNVFECFEADRATYYEAQNRQVFDTGEILHVEEAIDTPDGIVYLDTYKIPLKQPDGQVYALIGTSRDVTELVTARQTLETQALQLEATNQELQSFSYSVSHDLRAPLRHINGFITALKQRLEATTPNPDPKIAHYIDVIEKSSQKMGLLIDGLLTLSRVGRREMTTCPVPLQPLAEHAIALLEDDPDSHGVQIHLDPLPTVPGDPTLLQQVFTNLISNAVKFSRDRRPAVIHIGHRPTDGAIFIQDNGVGFDMTYADKLFSPCQRLHKQEEFQGTGIGLAIVNRIIHRHGGHIWAESVIGEGTTFFFTLSPEPPLD